MQPDTDGRSWPRPAAVVRPDLGFMRQRLSRLVALGFGSGLAPSAPGTFGTLAAWIAFVVLDAIVPGWIWLVLIPAGFALGVWACGKTADDLGVADHGAIVWDEVVAFWLVLAFVPSTWFAQALAFALFRFFDIVKPPPIRHFDRTMKGGLGVMFDDAIAAFFTLLVMAFIYR
jgi:phosphatidylglycerophosphatase A